MGIEAAYPFIALAYGTFGLVFGVMLWWKTQRRIDRTKSAIETQVAAAVTDITAKLDAKLEEFDMPDMEPVLAKLDAFETSIPDAISTHIGMHMKTAKATEAKSVLAALEAAGMDFDAAGDEAKAMLEAQLPPEMIAMKKLLTAKIPKKIRDNHPDWAWFIDTSRTAGGQYLMQRMQERLGGGATIEGATAGSGFGVR